jgi:hypothetical protein
MVTDLHRIVRDWIDAEYDERRDDADRSFRLAAASLPRLEVPARFADVILARMGARALQPDLWASWWLRGLIAAAVLSAGVMVASLSGAAWATAVLASVHTVAWAVGHAWTVVTAWVGSALAAWSGLAHAAIVVGRLLAGRDAMLILVLNLTVAAGALAALRRLIPMQEN